MAQQEHKIKLSFIADTQSAKNEINSLGQQLDQILNKKTTWSSDKASITKDLEKAQNAARELKVALNQAFDQSTGVMDFEKFNKTLKEGGLSASALRQQLTAAGTQGTQAFMSLSKAVISAEAPAKRISDLMGKFGTTLINNLRWIVSSNIIQGISSSINEAFRYAENLDKSLNDIRIVTGKTKEEMDKFAKSANKAAKELSATTDEYAKASLIFYQQGLDEKAVKQRTDAVIKMANVTGESADEVSSYMTAIWNNFDDGSKSLEHYADVITSLGAATASSSEEIAGGLEKFAAIANTVGLSYEYATAALATVVSETRESEDTIGTAFKTIFGRLESLNLGETLDDDTTLTKYSAALEAVGVNIKMQNGALKDMDAILDDLGNKWKTLDKDQQVALANTVAGTRQYANFIALMDNYDKVKANIEIAKGSEGELQRQADIYAESWEAARDRVKAAAEEVYDNLLNSEDFIKLLNLAEKAIGLVARLVDGMGGLYGIIGTIGAVLLSVGKGKIADELRKGVTMVKDYMGITQKQAQTTKQSFLQEAKIAMGKEDLTEIEQHNLDVLQDEFNIQEQLISKVDNLTEREKGLLNVRKEALKTLSDTVAKKIEEKNILDEDINTTKNKIKNNFLKSSSSNETIKDNLGTIPQDISKNFDERYAKVSGTIAETTGFLDTYLFGEKTGVSREESDKFFELASQKLLKNQSGVAQFREDYKALQDKNASDKELQAFWKQINDEFSLQDRAKSYTKSAFIQGDGEEGSALKLNQEQSALLDDLLDKEVERTIAIKEQEDAQSDYNKKLQETEKWVDKAGVKTKDWADITVEVASAAMGIFGAFQALSNLGDIWHNDELSFWEKMLSTIIAIGSAAGALVPAFKALNSIGGKLSETKLFTNLFSPKGQGDQKGADKTAIAVKTEEEKSRQQDKINTKQIIAAIRQATGWNKRNKKNTGSEGGQQLDIGDVVDKDDSIDLDLDNKKQPKKRQPKKPKTKKVKAVKPKGKGSGKALKLFTKGGGGGVTATAGAAGAAAGVAAISAVLIAIGTAVIAGAKKIVDNTLNATKKEFERAQKYYEEAANRHQQAQEKYNATLEQLDAYKKGSNGLDTLIKGTDEWNKKLEETNASALELIKNYGHLIEYKTGADGEIIITSGLEEAEAAAAQDAAAARAGKMSAEVVRNEAQIKKSRQDFNRKNARSKEGQMMALGNIAAATGAGAVGGAAIGAGVGGIVGGIAGGIAGTAAYGTLTAPGIWAGAGIGAGVGGYYGAIIGGAAGLATGIAKTVADGLETETENEALDTVKELYKENKALFALEGDALKQELREAGVTDETLIASLDENKETLENLIETEVALEATNRELIRQTGKDINIANKGIDYHKLDDTMQTAVMAIWRYQNQEFSKNQAEETHDMRNWFGKGWNAITDKESNSEKWFLDKWINWAGSNVIGENSLWGWGEGELIDSYKTMLEEQAGESGYTVERKWDKVIVKNNKGEVVSETSYSDAEKQYNQYYEQKMGDEDYKKARETTAAIGADLENALTLDMANVREKALFDQLLVDYTSTLDPAGEKQEITLEDWNWRDVNELRNNINGITDADLKSKMTEAVNEFEKKVKNANLKDTENWTNADDRRQREAEQKQELLSYFEIDTSAFEAYRDALAAGADIQGTNTEALNKVTEANLNSLRMYDTLYNGLSQYAGSLTTAKQGTIEYYKAISNIATQLTSSLGIDGLEIDYNFVNTNLDTITGLFSEDEATRLNSVQALQFALAEQSIEGFRVNEATYNTYKNLQDIIENNLTNKSFTAGQIVSGSDIGLNVSDWEARLASGETSAEDFESFLKLMGLSATITNGKIGDITYIGTTDFDTSAYEQIISDDKLGLLNRRKKELDQSERELNKLEKEFDEVSGAKKIANLETQIGLLEDQKRLLGDINNLEKEERDKSLEDLNKLAREMLKSDDFEFVLDENGNVTAESLIAFDQALVNSNVKYTDEQLDSIKKGIETVENHSETINNNTDKIDELNNTIDDDNWLGIEEGMKVRAEFSDLQMKKLETVISRIGEGWENSFERFSLTNRQLEVNQLKYDNIKTDLNSYFGENAFDDLKNLDINELTEEQKVALEKISGNAQELEKAYRDLKKSSEEDFINTISEINNEFSEQTNILNTLNGYLEQYVSIITNLSDMGYLSKEAEKEMINQINQEKQELSRINIETAKQQIAANQAQINAAKDMLESELTDQDYDFWDKELKRLEQEQRELQNTLLTNWEQALQVAQEIYTATINQAIEAMEKSFASAFGGSLDYMEKYYSQYKKNNELYLEDYEQAYELSKLVRSIEQDINSTTNVQAKQKLRQIQRDIADAMAAGNQISANDLDILQKQYDLKKAELALEEAQNAKTQVRLTQTENGWGYIYTASQENIDKATQDYEDKMYALQQANDQYLETMVDSILNLETTFASELQSVLDMVFDTEADKIAAINQLIEQSITQAEAYTKGLGNALQGMEELGLNTDIFTSIFGQDITPNNLYEKLKSSFEGLAQEVLNADQIRQASIDSVNELISGTGQENLQNYIGNQISSIGTQSKTALQDVKELNEEMISTYSALATGLQKLQSEINSTLDDLVKTVDALIAAEERLALFDGAGIIGSNNIIQVIPQGYNSETSDSFNITQYDTGGYTGTWGNSEGKIAVLHEKELILNRDDTSNFLQAINIMRDNIVPYLGIDNKALAITANPERFLEQSVSITAEFPNATNHSEIEQAFENIINMASQYAYRK